MYILDDGWDDQHLDYYCGPSQTRIRVDSWYRLAPVDDLYIVRRRDPAMLYNYLREVGPTEVIRKVVSRKKERLRNQKFVSAGRGVVVETRGDTFTAGDFVVFLAPTHPSCVDQLSLDDVLIAPATLARGVDQKKDVAFYDGLGTSHPDVLGIAGWSAFSGVPLDRLDMIRLLRGLEAAMDQQQHRAPDRLLAVQPRPVIERSPATTGPTKGAGLTATLFGLGNYAKTIVIPNLDKRIAVRAVHEIDPTQIGSRSSQPYEIDTSPLLRDDERPDVLLIAGFHHTHADLAVQALERGAAAVVEKPLVTTAAQLERLARAMEDTGGRLYAGFHKRYSPFNDDIRRDLTLTAGDPVSCHCIVYEIPLPTRHWYEWPNSGSRIVSNGCHWIDHFLYLNDFSPVVRRELVRTASADFVVVLELTNGAVFSMALTDAGSARIGVQEHVEFRTNGRTAHIINAGRYFAESGSRVLTRRTTHKYTSFRNMYRTISSRIVNGEPGDTIASTIASSRAMLEIEALLARQLK